VTYGAAPRLTGLHEYTFERLQETPDSVRLFGVVPRDGSQHTPVVRCFQKGNMTVEAGGADTLRYLEVQQLVRQRARVRLPGRDTARVAHQPVVDVAIYWFYPRTPLKTKVLTNRGIFHRMR
jgi:hypothetical protein